MFFYVFICKIYCIKISIKSLHSRYLHLFEYYCRIKDEEDMLLYQGVLAFEYFTNTKASTELSEAMREGLKK
jgi:shikimate 5-dehydrogenase